MPSYAKFMKDILSRKRKLGDNEVVMMNEECSAVLQQKLPQKLKDPGSFSIPCTIGNLDFEKALCDLGASINLMPSSVFKKLGLGEVQSSHMSLQLADRSIIYPKGIIEDVLVKVDKFIFPADFVVLDMEEDREMPLILGRPFLATGRTLIDVQQGKVILRVDGEQVIFDMFKSIKHPSDKNDTCFAIDIVDKLVEETFRDDLMCKDPLEMCLIGIDAEGVESDAVSTMEACLDAMPIYSISRQPRFEEIGRDPERPIPSIDKPPTLELKPLLTHLKYAFLQDMSDLPVITKERKKGESLVFVFSIMHVYYVPRGQVTN